jgi:TRAP-type C4-dicarboxylate transport system permease small subunit
MPRLIERICGGALTLAGWCYLAITLLICFDITARRLLGFSTESTVEISGYLMAVGMSWGLAGTLVERAHVRIDVLLQRLPLAVRVWLHLASLLALLVAVAAFAWGAVRLAMDSYELGATDLSTLRMPMVVPQGLWAAGLVLMVLAVIGVGAQAVRRLLAGDDEGVDHMLMARTYIEEAAETLEALAIPEAVPAPNTRAAEKLS